MEIMGLKDTSRKVGLVYSKVIAGVASLRDRVEPLSIDRFIGCGKYLFGGPDPAR